MRIRSFIALSTVLLLPTSFVDAKDNGQYGNVDPQIREWIGKLKDAGGNGCCASSDGTKIDEADWRRTEQGYQVYIKGEWYPISDTQLIKETNRVGYAIVWYWVDDRGKINIRCFLRGSEA